MAEWIKEDADRMKEKSERGSFGKAAQKKISGAMKRGGGKKKGIFASTMKKIARKNAVEK